MKTNIIEIGSGYIEIPERKTDPLGVQAIEHYEPETVDLFKALLPGGDQHSGHVAFIDSIKGDLELFAAVRDETYNHDQFMEMRALVKYLSTLVDRAERIVAAAKHEREEEKDETPRTNSGPRVY
jgi:hypothetical protein